MVSKKRSEPHANQVGLFAPPSVPVVSYTKPIAPNPETVIGVAEVPIDLDTFDDYHDSHERNEAEDPARVVGVIPVDGGFEVSLRRHNGYAIHCFMWRREELEELHLLIPGALKST